MRVFKYRPEHLFIHYSIEMQQDTQRTLRRCFDVNCNFSQVSHFTVWATSLKVLKRLHFMRATSLFLIGIICVLCYDNHNIMNRIGPLGVMIR